jgi:hypothetical protein
MMRAEREEAIYNSGFWAGASYAWIGPAVAEHSAHGFTPMIGVCFFAWLGMQALSIRCMDRAGSVQP